MGASYVWIWKKKYDYLWKKYWLPKADRSLKLLTNFIIIGEILSVKDILTFISLLITYMFVSPKYFA